MDAKATGALIAGRRRELGLSQAELAERRHVTRTRPSAGGRRAGC